MAVVANAADDVDTYLCVCFGGLAALAADLLTAMHSAPPPRVFEIMEIADHVDYDSQGQCGCGKIILRTNAPPQQLWSSRCVSGWYALVAKADGVDDSDGAVALASLRHAARQAGTSEWERGLALLRRHAAAPWPSNLERPLASPAASRGGEVLFRVSAIRDGKHAFTSLEAAAAIGDEIGAMFGQV